MDQFAGRHAVVLGAAGFLGSHLCARLVDAGAHVTAVDNFITGEPDNLGPLMGRAGFVVYHYDVTNFLHVPGDVDFVLHFASPASPVDYLRWPIQTLKVGSLGTHKALGLARTKDARFLLASTSEVYGDPEVNPQPESYWGNVNPIGPRGVYDEAKRFAEALTLAYHREHGLDVRIARIFNSVLADEQVLYDDGTVLRRETAEEAARRLRDGVPGVSVPAFDGAARIQPRPVRAFIGHPTTQRCFEVRTRYGRSVRVTGDHSLFVEGADGPEPRPVCSLHVGDRIALARRIRVPERDRTAVTLVDVWADLGLDPWDLLLGGPGFGAVVRDHGPRLVTLLQRRSGGARQSLWGTVSRWIERDEAPLAAIRQLGMPLPETAVARARQARGRTRLAARVPVTDDLLWFLGLYVAEGGRCERPSQSAFITLACDEEILQRSAKVLERDLGATTRAVPGSADRPPALVVHGGILLRLLDHLGFPEGPARIPGWVLGLPLDRLKWFLEGYRQGDDVHSGLGLDAQEGHEFSTVSDRLKDDLVVALARFGLVASVGRCESPSHQRTGDPRCSLWRLTLSEVDPWSPLEWDRGVDQTLQARTTGDLVWASVREIREVPPTEAVYDFSVPGAENFVAGDGVMAHNTYGPNMRVDDGRAVPAFFGAALRGQPLPVHGDGSQTRSLCYVDDMVDGLVRLLASSYTGPVNLGNPEELTILELAEAVQRAVGRHPGVAFHPANVDDPRVRRPDTSLAEQLFGWKAVTPLADGLARTAPWFRYKLGLDG